MDEIENQVSGIQDRIWNVQQQRISADNVYQFLLYFDKLYDRFTDAEKKEFLNSFVERVDIYERKQRTAENIVLFSKLHIKQNLE